MIYIYNDVLRSRIQAFGIRGLMATNVECKFCTQKNRLQLTDINYFSTFNRFNTNAFRKLERGLSIQLTRSVTGP